MPPKALLYHLRGAFSEYLENPLSGNLEAALGTTSPSNRPATVEIEFKHDAITLDILRARLKGIKAKAAYDLVAHKRHVSTSQAEKIWEANRIIAFHFEVVSRGSKRPKFTNAEVKILKIIYRKFIIDDPRT